MTIRTSPSTGDIAAIDLNGDRPSAASGRPAGALPAAVSGLFRLMFGKTDPFEAEAVAWSSEEAAALAVDEEVHPEKALTPSILFILRP